MSEHKIEKAQDLVNSICNDFANLGYGKLPYPKVVHQESRNSLLIWIGALWAIITGALAIVAAFKTSFGKGILLFLILFLFLFGLFLLRMYLQI